MPLSELWQALPLPVMVVDAQDRITQLTPAFEHLANLSRRALSGRPLWSVVQAEPGLSHRLQRLRANSAPLTVNDFTARFASHTVQVNLRAVPVDGGQVLLAFDPAKSAGSKPRQAARSAIGLSDMLAHEIKNPLAGISGAAQLMEMQFGPPAQELTGLIVAETKRIVALLDQVAQFGDASPPRQQAVNLHDALHRARRMAELGFAGHMHLAERYDPSLPPAWVSPEHLHQVLLNLMKNAAEASPQGGSLQLHSFYDAGLRRDLGDAQVALPLHIELIDDGPGLPEEIADHVFDPFVTSKENGSGLGLALVSKLMLANGGWVEMTSAPGRTAVRLSLPRANEGGDGPWTGR